MTDILGLWFSAVIIVNFIVVNCPKGDGTYLMLHYDQIQILLTVFFMKKQPIHFIALLWHDFDRGNCWINQFEKFILTHVVTTIS